MVLLTWGLENIRPEDVPVIESEKADHRLVVFYQKANKMMESDPDIEKQVGQMLRRFEDGDEEVIAKVRKTAKLMLDGIIESLLSINVVIDQFTWESQFIKDGSAHNVVEELKRSEHCSQDNGACYLELKTFGIHGKETKFFFTRADGTTLYTTRDMAYHLDKFCRADRLINILGEDQKLGQAQLAIALKLLGKDRAPECVFYSFVSLPEGRMSTRKGTVVYLDDLIEEAEERALDEVRKRRTDLPEEKMREIARSIGRGAVRYNIVRVQPEKALVFKWEDALNFEGNSAPFVQYAHARACSIQRKAGQFSKDIDPAVLTNEYELRLIRVLARYPSVLREAGERARIQVLPAYGHEVAAAFNQFYTYVPVLKGEENKDARLALVDATRVVLANCADHPRSERPGGDVDEDRPSERRGPGVGAHARAGLHPGVHRRSHEAEVGRVRSRRRGRSWAPRPAAPLAITGVSGLSFVAKEGDKIVGFIFAQTVSWIDGIEKAVWVENIGVDPEFRRMGIGYLLLKHLALEGKKQGAQVLHSSISPDNVSSLLLHKKLGFLAENRKVAYLDLNNFVQ